MLQWIILQDCCTPLEHHAALPQWLHIMSQRFWSFPLPSMAGLCLMCCWQTLKGSPMCACRSDYRVEFASAGCDQALHNCITAPGMKPELVAHAKALLKRML